MPEPRREAAGPVPLAGSGMRRSRGRLGTATHAFLAAALVASGLLHLQSPRIPDPDSFYHLAHAEVYRTDGLFESDFPWVAWSLIREHGGDIWYGFHLLLVPFSSIADGVLRIKIPGILLTALLLTSIHWTIVRLGLAGPWLWPFVALLAGPNVLFHMLMTRPHVLSTALAALLFGALIAGGPAAAFLASAALVFVHLGSFWLVPMIVVIVLAAAAMTEAPVVWGRAAAALAGMALGWLLRPNPLGSARIVHTQIIELLIEKQSGVPLTFARELAPISWETFLAYHIPFSALWGGGVCLALAAMAGGRLAAREPRLRTAILSSLMLSVAFFIMMLVVARRSFDPWAVFGVLFLAAAQKAWLARPRAGPAPPLGARGRAVLVSIALVLAAAMAVNAAARLRGFFAAAPSVEESRDAALWLREHSRAGEIVYNVHWDAFPALFFWNRSNRYASGMDPIFLYAYDPGLYWKSHYLFTGAATAAVCGDAACSPSLLEDTFTALVRDFQAAWLLLDKARSPELHAYVSQDPRFILRYENAAQAVYRLGGDEAPPRN